MRMTSIGYQRFGIFFCSRIHPKLARYPYHKRVLQIEMTKLLRIARH